MKSMDVIKVSKVKRIYDKMVYDLVEGEGIDWEKFLDRITRAAVKVDKVKLAKALMRANTKWLSCGKRVRYSDFLAEAALKVFQGK